jgi:hypothetical protein
VPPSVTCSVHSEPDQYRCSWRPVGSTNQPGAIPVNVTLPGDLSTLSAACAVGVPAVNPLTGAGGLAGRRRPRRDGSARIAKKAANTTRKSQEP